LIFAIDVVTVALLLHLNCNGVILRIKKHMLREGIKAKAILFSSFDRLA
jgi:hypothetical protein